MYLTYDDYLDMGGNIPDEDVFNRLEAKACALLNRLTFGRLVDETLVRESVKYCMFDLLNMLYSDESIGVIAAGREIAAMSNDGVSMTFVSGSNRNNATSGSARYASIVRTWLATETTSCGVPLLYAGVCVT